MRDWILNWVEWCMYERIIQIKTSQRALIIVRATELRNSDLIRSITLEFLKFIMSYLLFLVDECGFLFLLPVAALLSELFKHLHILITDRSWFILSQIQQIGALIAVTLIEATVFKRLRHRPWVFMPLVLRGRTVSRGRREEGRVLFMCEVDALGLHI